MFLDNLLAAVAAGIALGLKPNTIRAGVERAVGREGPALFEKAEQIGLVTPARNLPALRAWIETLKQAFPGRRAHAVIEQARDWRSEDADAARSLVSEFFETFSVIAEGDCPPAAGALLSKPTETDTSPEARSTMTQAVSEKVESLGPTELLFVQTANTTSQSLALACFTEKGMTRRRTSGLASVEHCR
jgi:hypothetical protein